MDATTLKKLVNTALDINKLCQVIIDVWHPTVAELKSTLALGHDNIETNGKHIFDLKFDNYDCTKAPGFKITIFCDDAASKFMQNYLNMKGGDEKCK